MILEVVAELTRICTLQADLIRSLTEALEQLGAQVREDEIAAVRADLERLVG